MIDLPEDRWATQDLFKQYVAVQNRKDIRNGVVTLTLDPKDIGMGEDSDYNSSDIEKMIENLYVKYVKVEEEVG